MQQVLGFYSYEIRSHPVFSSRTTAYPSATSQPESSTIREEDLIKKSEVLDPLEEDDDDIEWKHNSFDIHHVSEPGETPAELMAKITFEGSPQFQTKLKALVLEFIDVLLPRYQRYQRI